jgi:hypothetical protein
MDMNTFHDGYGAIELVENRNSSLSNILFQNNYGYVNSCGMIINSNNFSLHDVVFSNNVGGKALVIGHGNSMVTYYDTMRLYNCHFKSNKPDYYYPDGGFGGGLAVLGQTSIPGLMTGYLYNCLFEDNRAKNYPNGPGSISLSVGLGSKAYAINCTFGDNTSENPQGANIGVAHNSDLYIYNSIMYGNYPAELYMWAFEGEDCSLSVYNSLVSGGEDGIRILTPWNYAYYDITNIDTDPMWDTTGPWPYSLLPGSPCIDAGTLDLPPGVTLPEFDLAGNPRVWGTSVDMGAYEHGPWVSLRDPPHSKFNIQHSKLLTVSPNPFRYGTYISYIIIEKGRLNISVYSLSGLKVKTLASSQANPGDKGSFYWDGSDQNGQALPASIYLIRMTLDGKELETARAVKQ